MLQYSNFSAIDSDKCFIAYEPNQCCGKVKCPEEPKVEVAYTCNVDGKEYREGEHIYLDDCNLCVCKPDFNSSYATNNPYCHRVLCHFNLDLLATGCIPVFVGNGCCAIDHHCRKCFTLFVFAGNYSFNLNIIISFSEYSNSITSRSTKTLQ